MTDTLHISTGEKRIAIERDGKPAGEIVFNPSDPVFAEKFYRLLPEFETKSNEFSQLSEETKDDMGKQLALLIETSTYFKEKIDYLFGAGTSKIAFGDANNLDMFSQFFEGITPHIRGARTQKIAQYMPPKPKARKRK